MRAMTIQNAGKIPQYSALMRDIECELHNMEKMLLDTDCRDVSMHADITRVITSGGKRLRPILAYLCYRLGGGVEHPILPLMSMLELMHTASLIHDDVVDFADTRRGSPTINATSGTVAAVQSGDYLLAEAMGYLHYYKGTGINEALVEASSDMCLGELEQLTIRHDLKAQTCEQYFTQIYRKTASLLAVACYSGGIAGGLTQGQSLALRDYGAKLGIAFQLCDDLLDLSTDRKVGKKPGQDIKNGIFTLPVLYLLESGVPEGVKYLFAKADKTEDDIARLTAFINASDAIDYTKSVIRQTTDEAINALREFPECDEKSALKELAAQMADRNN